MLTHLCGTPAVATKTLDLFKNSKVGCNDFLGTSDLQLEALYFHSMVQGGSCVSTDDIIGWQLDFNATSRVVEWGWRTMFDANLPSPKFWVLIPGTFFWISGTHLGRPGFLKALPKLLNNMTENYVTGSCCKAEHALERLIPAMVRYCGGEVVEMVARSDLLGTSSVWTFICSTKKIGFEWSVKEYFRQ